MATDAEGRFALKAAPGEYTLLIQYLGFDPVKKPVRVEQENHLGDFVMRTSATGIESVEVKARLVRREADRFVVDVANAPAAIGKDGIELLERAPGVWIDGEKISINGKSGSKVYVNDRAEEIQKIEVVPTSGADYDADSAGGIIRITLKKRRENGVNGSVAFNTTQGEIVHRYNPSANINLHSGRVDFYASAWGSFGKDETTTGEQTRYEAADKELNAHSSMKGRNRSLGASAGAVVEIDGRNSVGAEFEYWRNRNGEPNDTYTDFRNAGTVTRTDSHFDKLDIRNNYSATRISKTPVPMRSVNRSPKTATPKNNAVTGSSAPRIAVGVEPMRRMAPAIATSETIVGKSASATALTHIRGEGTGCRSAQPRSRTT